MAQVLTNRVEHGSGLVKFDQDGYTNVFSIDGMITTKVDVSELRKQAMFKQSWKLQEVDDILTRDVARILIPEILNEQIQTKVEEARIWRGLVDVVRVRGPTFSWLEEEGFEASQVPEGAEIPIQHATWEKKHASIIKNAVRCVITREMIEDSAWDIIGRHVNQGGLAMARLEDWMIGGALNDGVPNGLAISDGVGGIGSQIESHRFKMGADTTGNPLTWRAIAKALTILRVENYTPNVMVIHPYQMYDLLTMEEFIGFNERAYLTLPTQLTSAMTTGTIGSIGGMRVIVSANQPAGQVLIFNSGVYGVLAERRPVSLDRYDDYIRQMEGLALSQRLIAVAIRRDAAVMLTAGKTTLVT